MVGFGVGLGVVGFGVGEGVGRCDGFGVGLAVGLGVEQHSPRTLQLLAGITLGSSPDAQQAQHSKH